MSIVIKLDIAALNALFPEGSTARVELESAVIASVSNKIGTSKIRSEVRAELDRMFDPSILRAEVRKITSTMFDPAKYWSNEVQLSQQQKDAIQKEIQFQYRGLLREVLEESANTYCTETLCNELHKELTRKIRSTVVPATLDEFTKSTNLFARELAKIGLEELKRRGETGDQAPGDE